MFYTGEGKNANAVTLFLTLECRWGLLLQKMTLKDCTSSVAGRVSSHQQIIDFNTVNLFAGLEPIYAFINTRIMK